MYEEHFWSELHMGHKPCLKKRGWFDTLDEYHEYVCDTWITHVKPKDTIWLLGDTALTLDGLMLLKKLPGIKKNVLGNHCVERECCVRDYLEVFDDVVGLHHHRKGYFLSHAPMHAMGMRGRRCIHGHLHDQVIRDPRYINVSIDLLRDGPTTMSKIQSGEYRSYYPPVEEVSEKEILV